MTGVERMIAILAYAISAKLMKVRRIEAALSSDLWINLKVSCNKEIPTEGHLDMDTNARLFVTNLKSEDSLAPGHANLLPEYAY